MTTKQTYHHGNLREALLDATVSVINEDGVRGVTMRTLSERLGVSRSAAYRHFDGKADLLAEVARQGFIRLRDVLREIRIDRKSIRLFWIGFVRWVVRT